MTALGDFSPEALEMFQLAASEQSYEFSEGDTYDFTRCIRPDGSSYGTGGKCRMGTEAGPAEKKETKGKKLGTAARTKAQFNREEMENPKNQADMDHEGLKKLMAKSPTAQRKLREEAAAKKSTSGGMRDGTVAESRKAMKHQREQMNLHGNKIAELQDAGKKVPPALQAKYNLAKASYNSHRKAINAATGVEKSPVMQAAREAGRAEEKKNQEKRAIQRGEERVARAGARDRALTPKEQANVDAKAGRKPGPSKVAEGLQREQMRAERAARLKKEKG